MRDWSRVRREPSLGPDPDRAPPFADACIRGSLRASHILVFFFFPVMNSVTSPADTGGQCRRELFPRCSGASKVTAAHATRLDWQPSTQLCLFAGMRWGFLHAVVKSGVGQGGSAASSAAWGRESKLWYSWSSIPGKTSWIFAAWETRQESLDVLQGHRRVPSFPLRERKEKKKSPCKKQHTKGFA